MYSFLPVERVLFGPGSVGGIAEEVRRVGGRKAFVITGRSLATKTDVIATVSGALGPLLGGVFSDVRQHAPLSDVERAAKAFRARRADVLVSVGGGSPIDAAKAVAQKIAAKRSAPLPHIAIPTTLSAAEFSHLVGVTDEQLNAKMSFAESALVPRCVILDAELTLATPQQLWLSSGIRALDHAVETLYAPGLHPISDVLALEAIRRLFALLPRSRSQPGDLSVRTELQLASWMSFFGVVNAPLGLSHNLGRRMGATYGVPHGITSCITLPHVMRAMAPDHAPQLAPIARVLELPERASSDVDAALAAAGAVSMLIARLGLPKRLRDVGIGESEINKIANAAAADAEQRDEVEMLLHRML